MGKHFPLNPSRATVANISVKHGERWAMRSSSDICLRLSKCAVFRRECDPLIWGLEPYAQLVPGTPFNHQQYLLRPRLPWLLDLGKNYSNLYFVFRNHQPRAPEFRHLHHDFHSNLGSRFTQSRKSNQLSVGSISAYLVEKLNLFSEFLGLYLSICGRWYRKDMAGNRSLSVRGYSPKVPSAATMPAFWSHGACGQLIYTFSTSGLWCLKCVRGRSKSLRSERTAPRGYILRTQDVVMRKPEQPSCSFQAHDGYLS